MIGIELKGRIGKQCRICNRNTAGLSFKRTVNQVYLHLCRTWTPNFVSDVGLAVDNNRIGDGNRFFQTDHDGYLGRHPFKRHPCTHHIGGVFVHGANAECSVGRHEEIVLGGKDITCIIVRV